MRLTRLRLDGFGALRGEFSFDPGKLTLIVDDNERGKSTLLAGVAAALYGLDNDKRTHKVLTPLDRWRPWGGGTFRVELELDAGDRHLTVKRDFERGTVEVWDEQGREITSEFREGKDQFPVGRKLLGLDADEFGRCSFIAAGDLSRVIPSDPRERGSFSLRARLESAADSRLGDANATDAMGLIEGALRRYTCPELDSSLQIDNTITRLELKRQTLETELKTLEHDLDAIRDPIGELARLEDEEKRLRVEVETLEAGRRASLAGDVRRQLEEDDRHRDEMRALEAEAGALDAMAHLPVTAEAQFRETVARFEEQKRNLEALEVRRREGIAHERESIEGEMGELAPFVAGTDEDADRCVALAGELRRVTDEDQRLRDEVFAVRESMAAKGHEPERLQWLHERFGVLGAEKQALLRRQSELQLAYQTEVAGLERERTTSTETLRDIDAQRNRWQLPAWFLVALGFASAVAGVAVMLLHGPPVLFTSLLAGGALLLTAGLVLLGTGGRTREGERATAVKRLTDAQRRLGSLKQTRAETEVSLQIMARQMGYRDHVDLLREWSEYSHLLEDSGPALRAQQSLAALEQRRQQAVDEAQAMLARFGGGAAEPAELEAFAARIRRARATVRQAHDIEKRFAWIEEEKRVGEATAAGLHERAMRLLQDAGLGYDAALPWDQHAAELASRVAGRVRWQTLQDDLLPRVRTRLLDPAAVEQLRGQLASIESSLELGAAAVTRTPIELEDALREKREARERLQKRRADLRVQVDETARRYHAEHPDKVLQRERAGAALERARRFKHAAELARDTIQKVAAETHRRWADYLNHRVGELLGSLGTGIEQLRFGDDLDFSVRVGHGQQLARGKADLQLSAGARDQLYLAVRLAVSEFLSRGQEPLPMLLDDVFSTSDDGRALAGMRLLVGAFSEKHQVVLLTCHRKRCEGLAGMDPGLFRERVQWLDTGALVRDGS
jgi:hypothetical protein